MNNTEVQTLLTEANAKLTGLDPARFNHTQKVAHAVTVEALKGFQTLCLSCNDTPSFGGLGLTEAVQLATDVLAETWTPDINFNKLFNVLKDGNS